MKKTENMTIVISLSILLGYQAFAQGYDAPLTMQGLNNTTLHSSASRAAGGITIGLKNDAALMFSNPAALQTITGFQVSVGGLQQSWDVDQKQQWLPLRYLPNFSLLMEGLTGGLDDPKDTLGNYIIGGERYIYVQHPYDSVRPNWSRSKQYTFPVQVFAAIPFSIGNTRFIAGLGAVEYAALYHYFQNNNVLSPSLGSQRPYGIHLPYAGDTIHVDWFQYSQLRSGSIYGYGGALSIALTENLSFGISGMLLKGSTTDQEMLTGRGHLQFFQVSGTYYFINDSVKYSYVNYGTSDYSGQDYTLSALYRGKYINLGISVKPPTTITRKSSSNVVSDSADVQISGRGKVEDKMKLPWRGTAGFSLSVRENMTFGFEYEYLPYGSSKYVQLGSDGGGIASNPWLSSSVYHIGIEYLPEEWLAIRAGLRQRSEVFEPEGNALIGDPVISSVYSIGIGFSFENIRLNLAYEYSLMKYQDLWASNINLNSNKIQNISADLSYEIPW